MAIVSHRNRWLWAVAVIGVLIVGALTSLGMLKIGAPVSEMRRPPVVSYDNGEGDTAPKIDDVGPPGNPHALDPLLKAATDARKALQKVTDYTATFDKHEQVGRKLISTKMQLKVRRDPFSVYLKFVEPKANAGRQVIYVKGQNQDNLIVQETGVTGMLGPQSISPLGALAMADNRYPMTMIGLDTMLGLVIAQWEADRGFDDVTVKIESDVELPSGERCTVYESTIPTAREKVQFHRTRLWIDQKTNFAVRVEQFGFPEADGKESSILEDYTYSQLKTDVDLRDADFDAKQAFKK